MSVTDKLSELKARQDALSLGGGADKISAQHGAGKLTARERMNLLFDAGSFMELDAFAACRPTALAPELDAPCDGVICGYGTVDSRPVFAYAQDFTVLGGSVGEMHAKKIAKIIDMAMKTGAPVVAMLDSGGARIQEGTDALEGMGLITQKTALASGVIPQIAAVMGPCAGGAATISALSDFVCMTEENATLYLSGPSVIKGTTGQVTDAKSLGGAMANAEISGNCQVLAKDDTALIGVIRNLLSYLPSNNVEDAPCLEGDDINRLSPALNTIINGEESYDVKTVLTEIVDSGSLFELLPYYAKNIVTAFGRMNGATVGFVANQASEGGLMDMVAAEKAARFVRFCDSFNIPLVTLTDTDGYVADINQEQGGIVRKLAALSCAYAEATVPKLNLILRKAYGSAYITMGSKHIGADMTYAWPTAQVGVMHAEGAASILYKNDIKEAENPKAARAAFVKAYKETCASPYEAAKRGYVDDVISPDSTRQRIIAALLMLSGKRETLPAKKHSSILL